jgi:hypothetical protein
MTQEYFERIQNVGSRMRRPISRQSALPASYSTSSKVGFTKTTRRSNNGFNQTSYTIILRITGLSCSGVFDFVSRDYEILQKKGQVEASSQATVAIKRWPWQENYSPQSKANTGLHLAAYRSRRGEDSKDSYGRTPLSWAPYNGHDGVKLVLSTEGVDANSKVNFGQTPLPWAALTSLPL